MGLLSLMENVTLSWLVQTLILVGNLDSEWAITQIDFILTVSLKGMIRITSPSQSEVTNPSLSNLSSYGLITFLPEYCTFQFRHFTPSRNTEEYRSSAFSAPWYSLHPHPAPCTCSSILNNIQKQFMIIVVMYGPIIIQIQMSDLQVLLRHAKRSKDSKLDLSGKGISYIPNEVFSLEHLEILILSNNELTSLDSKIEGLHNLKVLDVSSNSLMDLPIELLKLQNLQALIVSGNPLHSKFQPLFDKEYSIAPQLEGTLKKAFGLAGGEEEKPSWLETKGSGAVHSDKTITKMVEYETMYKNEQNKVRMLEKELERMNVHQHHGKESSFGSSGQVLEIPFSDLELHEQISMGGFSVIHRGYYGGLEVAVKKVFNPTITEELLAEMENEVTMLSKYRHPNIVLMLGVCSVPPKLCIVMEYMAEGSLYDHLFKRKQELKEEEKRRVVKQIVSVIAYLHKHNIVHRDIKSHNFLIDKHLSIKLCDFGLARHKDDLNKGAMQFSGTPIYMAQEMFLKKGYTSAIDVFALGTLIYQLYTREIPYNGLDPADIKDKILKDSNLPIRNGISKSVLNLVNQCRQENPSKRPTMEEISKFSEW